ncbi:MAG: HD domain-containing protein [Acidobacteriota bacterium]|nr:HD domain-containing protein [Acidobacteriota bacterium]
MSNLARAIALAAEAHVGQLDKSGAPYILHPIRVMLRMSSEVEMIVAILHDVVEDTPWTFDRLRAEGFSQDVLTALDGVTRRPEETYHEFVARSKTNPISRQVKIADLEDNMDLKRLGEALTEHTVERLRRYQSAWHFLRT